MMMTVGAPAPEEQQDHQSGQRRRNGAFANHAGDGGPDEGRLVPHCVQVEPGRQSRLNPGQPRLDTGDNVQGRGRAGIQDRHQHGLGAVDADDVGLRRRAVMRIGDVAHVDHRAVDLLHREVVDPVQHSWAGIEGNVPLEHADLLRAGWKH